MNSTSPNNARVGWVPNPTTRGTETIIQSCLATIFICTWVSVHENVPPSESKWRSFARKLKWMLIAIFAPELVTGMAFKQWGEARSLTSTMKDKIPNWSTVQSFYALMGGFHIQDSSSGVTRVLDPSTKPARFAEIVAYMAADVPKTAEIEDKSKGDAFSKGLAVWQSSWFLIQCLTRWGQHLPISELELSTIAFVCCTLATYCAWWPKPLNVKEPTVLRPPPPTDGEPIGVQAPIPVMGPAPTPAVQPGQAPDHPAVANDEAQNRIPNFNPFAKYYEYQPECCEIEYEEDDEAGPALYQNFNRELQLAFLVGMFFGSIHLVGWNFSFPTDIERTLWRVAALVITAFVPIAYASLFCLRCFMECSLLCSSGYKGIRPRTWWTFAITFIVIYSTARLIIIIELFLCFRSMPKQLYIQANWSSYIPFL